MVGFDQNETNSLDDQENTKIYHDKEVVEEDIQVVNSKAANEAGRDTFLTITIKLKTF